MLPPHWDPLLAAFSPPGSAGDGYSGSTSPLAWSPEPSSFLCAPASFILSLRRLTFFLQLRVCPHLHDAPRFTNTLFHKLNPRPRRSLRRHISEFDFVGLGLITGGIACLLLAFTFSQTSWSSPITIALLTSSGALCAGGMFSQHCHSSLLNARSNVGITHEFYTRRHPIIPPRIFKTRTTLIILFSVLVHAFAFFATPFCKTATSLPISPGTELMPRSRSSALFSISGIKRPRFGIPYDTVFNGRRCDDSCQWLGRLEVGSLSGSTLVWLGTRSDLY